MKLLSKAEQTKEFAVLPYQEFLEIQQILEDFEDLQELREAKAEEFNAPTSPLSQVLAEVSQSRASESQRASNVIATPKKPMTIEL